MTERKKALITGITGQDGSYLAEFLLEKGYEVFGVIRRSSSFNTGRIDHLFQEVHGKDIRLTLIHGDLGDSNSVYKIIKQVMPDEIYHLGAQSHVRVSFDIPEFTANTTGLSTVRLLEAIRDLCPEAKFYQASSSEMFGEVKETPQTETTPFNPRSPYACAKVYAFWVAKNYREAYNLFTCNGILFNHESPRRGKTFVTKKITNAIAKIKAGKQKKLYLGNLDAKRDWGYAKEYVQAMWLMLQQEKPDDYVIATNETHSVKDFLREAFSCVGLNWEEYVELSERYIRPTEVDVLQGDYSKAKEKLGWKPKTDFKNLVKIMLKHDFEKEGLNFEEHFVQ